MGALLEQLPLLEFRRHYSMAQMAALVANALGGKNQEPATPKAGEKPFNPFTVVDFMPFYARPAGFIDSVTTSQIPEAAAADFLEATRRGLVPDWVLNLAPINAIRAAAKGR